MAAHNSIMILQYQKIINNNLKHHKWFTYRIYKYMSQ